MTGSKNDASSSKSLNSRIQNRLGLSLRARFFLPSFIGIILALILNLSYQSILVSNQNTFRQLKDNNLPQISDISRISVSLVKNQNKLSKLLLSTVEDPDEERVYLEGREIYQSLYSLEESIKSSLETSSDEDQVYLLKIKKIFTHYKYSVENALEISTVDTKLALEELIKSGDASQQLNDLFINLSDYHAKSLNISDILLNNSLQDQTKINIISISLIFIMIILPILFFRKLTSNLDQINRALVTLNNGGKNVRLPKTNDTYINNLVDVVVSFQKTLSELVESKKIAEQSSIAKSEFLAVMSHEIRTPMNGVLGMLNRIAKSDLSEDQKNLVNTAQKSANSLLEIINDILDFTKIDAGKLEVDLIDFDLVQLIKTIVSAHTFASDNTLLTIESTINLPTKRYFQGDPIRTKQILDNILSNAIKFTKQGTVNLTVNCSDKTPDIINVEFSIKDTGCGISKEQLTFLFEPFTQADSTTTRKYGGTGLGLSIARRLCHLMEGNILVSSIVNSGSEFTINLPFKYSECENIINNSSRNTQPALTIIEDIDEKLKVHNEKNRVLVVEDNAINIEVITFLLEDLNLNLEVVTATDGSKALNTLNLSSITSPFKIILMDCQMPVMDGYEASKQIRAGNAGDIYLNIPIIAITANAMKGDKEKCFLAGMTDFISKPIDESELKSTLVKHLQ